MAKTRRDLPGFLVSRARAALDEFRYRHSAEEIESMPSSSIGQADDLIHETDDVRIWRSRVDSASGYYGEGLSVEVLHDGRWETVIE